MVPTMALTKQQEEKILKKHGFQWYVDLQKELLEIKKQIKKS